MLQFHDPYVFDKLLNGTFYAGMILPAMGVLEGVLTVPSAIYLTLMFIFAFLFVFVGYSERMMLDLSRYLLKELRLAGATEDGEEVTSEVISISSEEELGEALDALKEKITKDMAKRETKRKQEEGED